MGATSEISGLRRRFDATVALDGMSFTVAPGDVTGFAGPNGAGKSTTMRVILGLDAVDAGGTLICGRAVRPPGAPAEPRWLAAGRPARQPGRSGRNHLLWLSHAQRLNARRAGGTPLPTVPS